MYMSVVPTYMYVPGALWGQERVSELSRLELQKLQTVMSHQAGAEKQTRGPLEKQTVPLTTEPYCQPPVIFSLIW